MIVTVDTNVLFYAGDRQNPEKRAIASSILKRLIAVDCVLTTQVLGEFLNAVRRKNPAAYADALVLVEGWSRIFPTIGTTPDHLLAAAALADHHMLQFWDSVILTVARSAGAGVMLSEDMQDGATIGGLSLLNPFTPENRHRLDALLVT